MLFTINPQVTRCHIHLLWWLLPSSASFPSFFVMHLTVGDHSLFLHSKVCCPDNCLYPSSQIAKYDVEFPFVWIMECRFSILPTPLQCSTVKANRQCFFQTIYNSHCHTHTRVCTCTWTWYVIHQPLYCTAFVSSIFHNSNSWTTHIYELLHLKYPLMFNVRRGVGQGILKE